MYGNEKLPGIATSQQYRNEGSLWQGSPSSTWFKTVKVNGSEAEGTEILRGTIMKELTDGTYTPIAETDIITTTANLPGARLAIVADNSAKTGTTTTQDEETVKTPSSVLVGISGKVDKGRLYIGDKKFSELTDEQQISLNVQLEAWGFQLVSVQQS
ncbi:MAG: hypothetical protein IJU48_02715 [Synergistaceae bacterium]|nr:hypothetical protein [Synergistaceae bacterium]